ncbi:MAG: hypothetical protein HY721_25450 [Planctomycetes bacterium]|nr:hypothetical protein [Planctomycetota bacterium]
MSPWKRPCTAFLLALAPAAPAAAQCPEEPPLKNFTGGASVTCPCFAPGERAGVVLQAPAEHYPIEVLRVGIAWASQFGSNPQSLEQAVLVYARGLPDPGPPVASLEGPVLTDGALNEFDLEPLPGEIVIESGPFTVALELLNASTLFGPSTAHDGNGCQRGKNVVFAVPGGWKDACALGATGDWVMYAVYRPPRCGGAPRFVRGDDNADGKPDISDAVYSLAYQFLGGPSVCRAAMDSNGDGELNISDPIYTLAYLFAGGPAPPAPFPACGASPSSPELGCEGPVPACP